MNVSKRMAQFDWTRNFDWLFSCPIKLSISFLDTHSYINWVWLNFISFLTISPDKNQTKRFRMNPLLLTFQVLYYQSIIQKINNRKVCQV